MNETIKKVQVLHEETNNKNDLQNNNTLVFFKKNLMVVGLVFGVVCLLCIPIFYFSQFYIGVGIMVYTLFAIFLEFITIWCLKKLKLGIILFGINAFIILSSIIYYTGGVASPFIISLFALGPILFLFVTRKAAIKGGIICGIGFLFLFLYEQFITKAPQLLTPQAYTATWLLTYLYNTVFLVMTILSYKRRNEYTIDSLIAANKELKESNQDLERFAYIASHDLKSPLRSMISFINVLIQKYSQVLDKRGKEFLHIMSTNAKQMNMLVEDILEFSKTQDRTPTQEEVNMNTLLERIRDEIMNGNQYPGSRIDFGDLPILLSDFTMLKQVFQNIIENGLKYNQSTEKRIEITYQKQAEYLYFNIKDNGIGMEEKYLDKIFIMFERLHTKDEYQGTGIGLAVCKKIIGHLSGEINVKSAPGKGTSFMIRFPANILLTKEAIKTQVYG